MVCPDLRGYGRSSKPATTSDHAPYSKRAMSEDILAVAQALGHQRFHVAGHDCGSCVASRLTRDHPEAVISVAQLDSVPIIEALERCTDRFATAWWHWFFFAQPNKPERAILANPDAWYGGTADVMGREAFEEYRRAINDPATVHCMLEDYRPTLVLWSTRDDLEYLYGDPLEVWTNWASDLRGHGVESGHHMAEEAPEAVAAALTTFFGHPA